MNKSVLLVEDDVDQLYQYKKTFDAWKIPIITATDPEIGFELAKKNEPAAILIDVAMKIENGGELLLKNLKADQMTKSIPVIIFTNFEKPPVKDKYLSMGAIAFWHKGDFSSIDIAAKTAEFLAG